MAVSGSSVIRGGVYPVLFILWYFCSYHHTLISITALTSSRHASSLFFINRSSSSSDALSTCMPAATDTLHFRVVARYFADCLAASSSLCSYAQITLTVADLSLPSFIGLAHPRAMAPTWYPVPPQMVTLRSGPQKTASSSIWYLLPLAFVI